jgi:hypothetical protein
LVNETTGAQVFIGGNHEQGWRIKPGLLAHVTDKEKDFISLQRGSLSDMKEKVTSTDGPIMVHYSASFGRDQERASELRNIDPASLNTAVEGAITSLIRVIASDKSRDQLLKSDVLKETITKHQNINEAKLANDKSPLHSSNIDRLLERWPITNLIVDIEYILPPTEDQATMATERKVADINKGVIAFRNPLPPKQDTLQFRLYLREALELLGADHEFNKPGRILSKDEKDLLVAEMLKHEHKHIPIKDALLHAMAVARQASEINITGSGTGGTIVATNSGQSTKKHKKNR